MIHDDVDAMLYAWLFGQVAEPDGCLLFPGSLDRNGYGRFELREDGARMFAHRYACLKTFGPPPAGAPWALHLCRQKDCFSPEHLEWGSPSKNNGADKRRDGTAAVGEVNARSRLTGAQVVRIRGLSSQGRSAASLGREFGVTAANIAAIVARKTWKDVPEVEVLDGLQPAGDGDGELHGVEVVSARRVLSRAEQIRAVLAAPPVN
jgi:hypothetical protein